MHQTFVSETFDQVRLFADMRLQVQQSPQLEEAVEKIIAIHMKTVSSFCTKCTIVVWHICAVLFQ